MHAPDVLDQMSCVLGDGQLISLLQDNWLADLPLCRWLMFISTKIDNQAWVSDLIHPQDSGWLTQRVVQLFGDLLAKRVFSLEIPILQGPDVRTWQSLSSSRMVTQLYEIYRDKLMKTMDGAWIQRLGVHPRVSLFIWKIAWSRLPTRALIRDRGIDIRASLSQQQVNEEDFEACSFLLSKSSVGLAIGHLSEGALYLDLFGGYIVEFKDRGHEYCRSQSCLYSLSDLACL